MNHDALLERLEGKCECGCHSGGCDAPGGCQCGKNCPCQSLQFPDDLLAAAAAIRELRAELSLIVSQYGTERDGLRAQVQLGKSGLVAAEELIAERDALREQLEASRQDAERCNIIFEDDGDYAIDIYANKMNTVSMSFHRDGNINWAGILNGVTAHGLIKDTEMGRLVHAVAAIDAANGKTP